ncbi:hypothetical protein BH20ACT15_BH20ACT15_06950 [soil metagenome]
MRARRSRFTARAGALPALVSFCLIAGCGGDDGGSATTDADVLVPSKRDYIVQADTICGQSEQGIQTEAEVSLGISAADFEVSPSGKIVFKRGRRPSDGVIRRFGEEVVVPRLREQIDDVRALTPPTGDEAEVEAIFDTAEAGVDKLAADPALFNDEGAVSRELNQARRLARSYGFFDCGTYTGP